MSCATSERSEADPGEHEQRPDDVELLLRRERPVVLHRRRGVRGGQVVDSVARQRPVLDVRGRAPDLLEELLPEQAGTKRNTPTAVMASTTRAAGSSRRARRAQKSASRTRPLRCTSRSRLPVIRKPEMTKKTSTPM